jgi:hypothetical protein
VGTEIGTLLGAAAQLSLAAAFLWASLSKAAAQRGFRQTILQIGVPGRLTRLTASTVIGLELLAGVSLLIVPAWWWPRSARGRPVRDDRAAAANPATRRPKGARRPNSSGSWLCQAGDGTGERR